MKLVMKDIFLTLMFSILKKHMTSLMIFLTERMKIKKVGKSVVKLHNKKSKNLFWWGFFKVMCNVVFGKTIKNVRKHRDIKLITTKARRNYLQSIYPHYLTGKNFLANLLVIEMKRTGVLMNKPVYLRPSILE